MSKYILASAIIIILFFSDWPELFLEQGIFLLFLFGHAVRHVGS